MEFEYSSKLVGWLEESAFARCGVFEIDDRLVYLRRNLPDSNLE